MEKLHVLLIYRRMIPSIRLCGHSQLEVLAANGSIEYKAVQENSLTNAELFWADCVVLGRTDSVYELALGQWAHEAGKKVIYILDDDLLAIPDGYTSTIHYGQPSIQRNIRAMLALSDALLSPNPLLLKKYAASATPILMEEPALSPIPYRAHDPAAPVKIGFAGSVDRTGDIEQLLRDSLLTIKREYGDRVSFGFFGAIPAVAKELDAQCIPYRESYDQYRETLNSLDWDIGLAPMPDTPFHACKHYNKFVEYAAAGIVGIYSDVMPYTRLRDKPVDVLLCPNNADAWTAALRRLLDDRAALEEARRATVTYVHDTLLAEHTAAPLWDYLQTLPLTKHDDLPAFPFLLHKALDPFRQGWLFLQKYGLKSPVTLVQKLRQRAGI